MRQLNYITNKINKLETALIKKPNNEVFYYTDMSEKKFESKLPC